MLERVWEDIWIIENRALVTRAFVLVIHVRLEEHLPLLSGCSYFLYDGVVECPGGKRWRLFVVIW